MPYAATRPVVCTRAQVTPMVGGRLHDADDALAGVRGSYKNWDFESAVSLMGSKVDQVQRGFFSDSGFKSVVGDYKGSVFVDNAIPLDRDFFNKPGGYKIGQPNSQVVIDTLFPRTLSQPPSLVP